jgi:hypothetical protein
VALAVAVVAAELAVLVLVAVGVVNQAVAVVPLLFYSQGKYQ